MGKKSSKDTNLYLIPVMFAKEKLYWQRTKKMKEKFSWFGYILAVILLSLVRICIVTISLLFELYLLVTDQNRFRYNIQKMHDSLATTKIDI